MKRKKCPVNHCVICGKVIIRKPHDGPKIYNSIVTCRTEGMKKSPCNIKYQQQNSKRMEVEQRFCILCGDPIVRGHNESPSVYERSLYCRNEDKTKSKCYRQSISKAKHGTKMPPRRPYAERGYIDTEPPITVWADHHPEMPEEESLKLDHEQIRVNKQIDRKVNEKCGITSGLIHDRFWRGALR